MSTEDDRPQAAGGYSDSGLFDPNDTYSSPGYGGGYGQPAGGAEMFDEAGYSSASTTLLPGGPGLDDDDYDERDDRRTVRWHGGIDFGLLVLRLTLGALFLGHGLDKLFGWFGTGASGLDAAEEVFAGFGFSEPRILALVAGIVETGGGALLVLGLFTPAAAAAVLGVLANAIAVKLDTGVWAGGVEMEVALAAAAFALLFTGPGRVALDRHTPWFRKAPAWGFAFLVIAAGLSAVTLLVFR